MGEDEVFVSLVCGVVALVAWAVYFFRAGSVKVRPPGGGLGWLLLGPAVSAVLLLVVLRVLAAHDVRGDVLYIAMYQAMGAAWAGLFVFAMPLMGLRPMADAVQRGIGGAGFVAGCLIVAVTLAFAGANIGDGPGWWVVVLCAVLSTAVLLVCWGVLQVVVGPLDRVLVDRDNSAALRLGVCMVCCGAVLGRSVAGTWVDLGRTIEDFMFTAWPVVLLVAAECVVSMVATPRVHRPRPSAVLWGGPPAVVYLVLTCGYLVLRGVPA
ncbi:MAG: hypothetical protein U0637_00620 [Phycisphaerales bacterium]